MLKKFPAQRWRRHILVAVGYAIGYTAFRAISFSHWSLFAGFQLAALLIVPYEYWPALVLGELGPLGYVALDCVGELGLAWAVFKMLPSIVLIMPIVYVCRERYRLFNKRTSTINMSAFVLCAWVAAVLVAADYTALLSLAPRPAGYSSLEEWALRYGIGHYLGILTVTPLALCIYQAWSQQSLAMLKEKFAESRLLVDSGGILLPSLGLLLWIGWRAGPSSDVRYIAQVAMFLPMVALALRHGWQGAAIGGSVSSVAIVMLMPARYDHETMQAQTFIAFAITTMLLVGTRVTTWSRREQQEKQDTKLALSLAQRNYYAGEQQLRQAGYILLEVQMAGYRLLDRLSELSPHEFEIYDRRTRPVIQRAAHLIDHFIPLSRSDRSLPQALLKGGLAQVLRKYRVPVRVSYHGNVGKFAYEFHTAIYRLICDSILLLGECLYLADIVVSLRCRKHGGQRWVILHVRGRAGGGVPVLRDRNELLWQLRQCSRGNGFQSVQDGAATFGGTARQRRRGEWLYVTALLREPMPSRSATDRSQIGG